jgi:hypothetical protein
LRAFPSEVFQQMREEQAAGVVAGAEYQEQRDEQGGDDDPSLSFSLRHRNSPERVMRRLVRAQILYPQREESSRAK